MKLLPILLAATMAPVPALAGYQSGQPGWSRQCFRNVYREQYIPGTQHSPGYVRRWTERQEVPCHHSHNNGQYYPQPHRPIRPPVDDNSCIEGSILGGIAGAAGGAALSRDQGRFIGIPLGIVGGAILGCQLDGG